MKFVGLWTKIKDKNPIKEFSELNRGLGRKLQGD